MCEGRNWEVGATDLGFKIWVAILTWAINSKILQEIVQYADPVPELTVYQALFNKLKGRWNDSECLMVRQMPLSSKTG